MRIDHINRKIESNRRYRQNLRGAIVTTSTIDVSAERERALQLPDINAAIDEALRHKLGKEST